MNLTTPAAHPAAACAQTLHRLLRHLDQGEYDALAHQFTETGAWLRQGQWLRGRPAIVGALSQRPPNRVSCHLLANLIVDAEGPDGMHLQAYLLTYRHDLPSQPADGPPWLPGAHSLGNVQAHCVREGADWRVATLQTTPLFDLAPR